MHYLDLHKNFDLFRDLALYANSYTTKVDIKQRWSSCAWNSRRDNRDIQFHFWFLCKNWNLHKIHEKRFFVLIRIKLNNKIMGCQILVHATSSNVVLSPYLRKWEWNYWDLTIIDRFSWRDLSYCLLCSLFFIYIL